MKVIEEEKELVIRISKNSDTKKLRDYLDLFVTKEILSKAKGTQEQAKKLANDIDSKWWKKNKQRFIK